jgi:hypothetical protein
MGWALMPGLQHIKKETKRGFWPGALARVKMYGELVVISFKLYFLHTAICFFTDRNDRDVPGSVREPAAYPPT